MECLVHVSVEDVQSWLTKQGILQISSWYLQGHLFLIILT